MPNWVGGAAVGRSYYSILPYPSVRMFLGGGVPAGLVGGRHTQPGSTRTPSPACGSGKQSYGAASAGRRRWQRRPQAMRVLPRIRARPSNCSESPKASGTVLGWRHLWTPCCSMGVTIRWLWGVKQPSRLTCSATNRLGLPARQGLFPLVRVPERLRAVLTLCGCGLS